MEQNGSVLFPTPKMSFTLISLNAKKKLKYFTDFAMVKIQQTTFVLIKIILANLCPLSTLIGCCSLVFSCKALSLELQLSQHISYIISHQCLLLI